MPQVTSEEIDSMERDLAVLRGCVRKCAIADAGETVKNSLGEDVAVTYSAAKKTECSDALAAHLASVQAKAAGWTV